MHPFTILFGLFLIIPIIEISLLIKIGGIIGAPITIFLVVFTALLGAWLLRIQGFATIQNVRKTLEAGAIPAIEILEAAVLLLAGALLLTPGFFTDTIGFLCLIPALRKYVLKRIISKWIPAQYHTNNQQHNDKKKDFIEAEYHREDD